MGVGAAVRRHRVRLPVSRVAKNLGWRLRSIKPMQHERASARAPAPGSKEPEAHTASCQRPEAKRLRYRSDTISSKGVRKHMFEAAPKRRRQRERP